MEKNLNQSESIFRTFSKEWISTVAQKIKPNVTAKINIEVLSKSSQSFVDHPIDINTKPTIFIGTLNNSEGAIIGALAHELAHLLLPLSNFTNKFYYRLFLRTTGSYHITNTWCTYIHFLNFKTFRDESCVDRLGIDLLKNAGMDTGYVKEMLTNLLKYGNLNVREMIIARMRLLKIYFLSFS